MTLLDVAHLFVALVGAALGAKLPDVDLAPLPVWRHRSAWTHGPLVAGALLVMSDNPLVWWFAVGALLTITIHLLSDAFPKHWHGGAFIKLYPLPFSLNAFFSWAWICAGVYASGWVWWKLAGAYVLGWLAYLPFYF